jgi:predicted MPP superfamily phosphohydrolase
MMSKRVLLVLLMQLFLVLPCFPDLIPWELSDCLDQCQTEDSFEQDESCVNKCIILSKYNFVYVNPNEWKSVLYLSIPLSTALAIFLKPYVEYIHIMRSHPYSDLLNFSSILRITSDSSKFARILVIHTILSYVLYGRYHGYFHIFPFIAHLYFQLCISTEYISLVFIRRILPRWFGLLFSWPAHFYFYAVWLGVLFTPAHIIGLFPTNDVATVIGIILSLFVLYRSLVSPRFCKEVNYIYLRSKSQYESTPANNTGDIPLEKPKLTNFTLEEIHLSSELNIFQITDCYLGTFMSEERLKNICQNVANHADVIDLVFICGKMESIKFLNTELVLRRCLEPLKLLKGHVFACLSSNDHAQLEKMNKVFKENDIIILKDEEYIASTRVGSVQIIGSTLSSAFGESISIQKQRLICLLEKYPRRANMPRIVIVNNPDIFPYIPTNNVDIVFSSPSREQRINNFKRTMLRIYNKAKLLLSLRLNKWRFTKKFSLENTSTIDPGKILYCHRGTGIDCTDYIPFRMIIPSEQSLVKVIFIK